MLWIIQQHFHPSTWTYRYFTAVKLQPYLRMKSTEHPKSLKTNLVNDLPLAIKSSASSYTGLLIKVFHDLLCSICVSLCVCAGTNIIRLLHPRHLRDNLVIDLQKNACRWNVHSWVLLIKKPIDYMTNDGPLRYGWNEWSVVSYWALS